MRGQGCLDGFLVCCRRIEKCHDNDEGERMLAGAVGQESAKRDE